MPDAELVAGLDRERLLEVAARLDGAIGFLAAHGYNDEYLMNFVQGAALCRVVAGAEKAMLADEMLTVDAVDGFFRCWRATDAFELTENRLTLAAALAAVSEEGEKT